MVRRKSLKFLSVALAVVVVGSALYYGTSKYISADIESDGEWAYIKNPTFDERRTIIFDAYISNRVSDENILDVTHNVYLLDKDLQSGMVSKIPVGTYERYSFWQSYWKDAAGRELDVSYGTGNIALAAEGEYKTGLSEASKIRIADFISKTKMSENRHDYQLGFLSLLSRTGQSSGGIKEDIPSEDEKLGEYLISQSKYGVQIQANLQKTNSDLYYSMDDTQKTAYNAVRREFSSKLSSISDTDKLLSDDYLEIALFSYYQTHNNLSVSGISNDFAKGIVGPAVSEGINAHLMIVRNGGYKDDEVAAQPVTAAASYTGTKEFVDGMKSVWEYKGSTEVQKGTTLSDTVAAENQEDKMLNSWLDDSVSVYSSWLLEPEVDGVSLYEAYTSSLDDDVEDDVARRADEIKRAEAAAATAATVELQAQMDAEARAHAEHYAASETGDKGADAVVEDTSETETGWHGVGTVFYDSKTATLKYKSEVFNDGQSAGYITFDPENTKTEAQLHYAYKGAELNLYAEPKTGNVYLTYAKDDGIADGKANGNPLLAIGGSHTIYEPGDGNGDGTTAEGETIAKETKLNGIMSVTVGSNGKFGGSFRYMGRVFNYNAETQLFEVPITIRGGKFNFGVDDPGTADEGGIFERTVLYMDSKGGVRGNVSNIIKSADKSFTGSLGFSSSGVVDFTFEASDIETTRDMSGNTTTKNNGSFGSLTIDSTGNLAGAVNIGKLAGFSDVFVGFGKEGITGVKAPVKIGTTNLGINYGKNGLSISSFVPIAGIPIPISFGQDAYGGWSLSLPFVGTVLKLGHNVDESPDPPAPKMNEDGSLNMSYIQMGRYETSRMFNTYRFYQVQPIKIEDSEMILRSQLIFDQFNEILGRNPTTTEFLSFYLYSGYMPMGTECRNMDTGGYNARMEQFKNAVRGLLINGPWHLPDGASAMAWHPGEYSCRKGAKDAGKDPDKECKKPAEALMQSNFVADAINNKNVDNGTDTDYESVKNFLDIIEQLAKEDPEIERIIQEFINNHKDNPTSEPIGDGTTVRFVNGFSTFVVPDYDEAILKNVADLASATATATTNSTTDEATLKNVADYLASATPTATANSTTDEAATEKAEKNILSSTKSAISNPRLGYVDTTPFINAGLEIFQYNALSENKWISTARGDNIPYMKAGIGYYIYNPGVTIGVEIKKIDVAETAMIKASLQKGWNLVANSTEKSLNLGEIIHSVVAGEDKTMVAMAKADEIHNRMYLIQDGTATEATKAFKLLNPLATDITAQIVGSLKPYWVFVK